MSEINDWESYHRVLPADPNYDRYKMLEKGCEVFEKLCGIRGPSYITNGKFSRLGRIPGMTNAGLVKPDYDILFKNVQYKNVESVMNLDGFLDAMQILSERIIFIDHNPTANLNALFDYIIANI